MLAASMINSWGTPRNFEALNGPSAFRDSSRDITANSTIRGIRIYSKKPHYKLRTSSSGESLLTVRCSAKADEVKLEAQADENSHGKLLKASENLLQNVADWKKAERYKKSGEIYEGKVDRANRGGLLVRFHSLQGFLPYSQMTFGREGNKTMEELANCMIGSTVSVKIIEVNEEEKQLTFSQKQAIWEKFVDQVNVGDVFEGRVNSLADFGAFVNMHFTDGGYRMEGLVHKSEISWDMVRDIKDYLKEGEHVRVKVIRINKKKSRIELSIKQLQADPLFETLDTLMPPEEIMNMDTSSAGVGVPNEQLPGLEQICQELRQEEGISDVEVGRQAFEKRVVSQDLELWLSHIPSEGGKFTLLARAGRQ
ncbi:hypothetical protein KI387_009493, partial [Taxus chinensis]